MKQSTDTGLNLSNTINHNQYKYHKLKILTLNVNDLNNLVKEAKFSNFLKKNKIDITQKICGKRNGTECLFGILDPLIKLQE